ncbi:hypothetical protein A3770_11p61800 [Chloropicon primus]|uniref:Uncharacterized protein n=2 Tax=Chloropicon primus TaxID=1764295 RepID=A0A5B8MVX0_9CHLO|nr:hypothetical protein A3770_11p61800 [Chloropicon primus]|eukprot:QDZ23662.1 hypothetical protein A3770_11p61800 [Chloropicon primus]
MVVLNVITQLSGVKKWLHREDFDFEQFVETNVHEESASYFLQASPAQHFLVGFKDRNLEDEYLENLVVLSKGKFLSGYAVSLGLFILGPLVDMIQAWPLNRIDDPNVHSVMAKEAVPTFCALLVLLFGLVACAVAYETESLRRQRRVILQITGAVYLSYVVIMSVEFAMLGNLWSFLYGKQGWILKLIFFDLPPLISLLFMSLPTFLVGEIMFLAILSFSVIIPTVLGYWQSMNDIVNSGIEFTRFSPFWEELCSDEDRPDIVRSCKIDYVYKMALPYILVNALMIAVIIVSALSEATNRRLFIWKKLTRAQHSKIIKDHKKKEETIIEMFQSF